MAGLARCYTQTVGAITYLMQPDVVVGTLFPASLLKLTRSLEHPARQDLRC